MKSSEQRFSDRADDYSKFRPGYPIELWSKIIDGAAWANSRKVIAVDVGAGTGISSKFLARSCEKVVALEPNLEMRKKAMLLVADKITFAAGTAERTGLRSMSTELVAAFQSFHWFHAEQALLEFFRLLRPGGRVALVWNIRNAKDSFTRGYGEIIREYADNNFLNMLDQKEDSGRRLLECHLFRSGTKAVIASSQSLTLEELLGRARSVSYLPKSGPQYSRMAHEMESLFKNFSVNDTAQMRYATVLYRADKPLDVALE